MLKADVIVVGSGFYGATIAERCANILNKQVVILEARNHVGGNAYSYTDLETGIEVHSYGSHLFHTSNEKVWEYVNQFAEFNSYRHKVVARHKNQYYPFPVNLMTLSMIFNRTFTPAEANDFFKSSLAKVPEAELNFETKALSLVGRELYEAFIKFYTQKQWNLPACDLPASVISRIPVRSNFESGYFSDTYEGLPISGFQSLFDRMLSDKKIKIHLNTDALTFDLQGIKNKLVVFTGPVDRFFGYEEGHLNWRTLDFEIERLDIPDFQGTSVVNYVDEEPKFTRIHEFKHLHPERAGNSNTIIMREFSRKAELNDEPYYPVNSQEDREMLLKYRKRTESLKNFIFGGRLGTYQYLDMHMAIASALVDFESKVFEWFGHE